MARSAIPDFGIEYPEYVKHEWPKYVGADADGEALIAKDEAEFDSLKELAVFPKIMGRDKHGKDVIANIPRDLEWKKAQVATPPEDPAIAKKRAEEAAAAEDEIKRKAQAYDDLMAGKGPTAQAGEGAANTIKDQASTGLAANALTKKTKAA